MSEIFTDCEDNLNKVSKRLQEIINQLENSAQKGILLKEAQNCLHEATDNLKQMEIELQGYNKKTKDELKSNYMLQKQKIEEIKKIYYQQEQQYDKQNLFGNQDEVKSKLLEQDRQLQQVQKLQEAKFVAYGIEQQSHEIMVELGKNSDLIVRNIDKSRNIRTDLADSFQLIRIMTQRISQNKLILYLVASIVFLAIVMIFILR